MSEDDKLTYALAIETATGIRQQWRTANRKMRAEAAQRMTGITADDSAEVVEDKLAKYAKTAEGDDAASMIVSAIPVEEIRAAVPDIAMFATFEPMAARRAGYGYDPASVMQFPLIQKFSPGGDEGFPRRISKYPTDTFADVVIEEHDVDAGAADAFVDMYREKNRAMMEQLGAVSSNTLPRGFDRKLSSSNLDNILRETQLERGFDRKLSSYKLDNILRETQLENRSEFILETPSHLENLESQLKWSPIPFTSAKELIEKAKPLAKEVQFLLDNRPSFVKGLAQIGIENNADADRSEGNPYLDEIRARVAVRKLATDLSDGAVAQPMIAGITELVQREQVAVQAERFEAAKGPKGNAHLVAAQTEVALNKVTGLLGASMQRARGEIAYDYTIPNATQSVGDLGFGILPSI